MSLILPHKVSVQQHSGMPWLWRVRCSCGYSAFAPDEPKALLCAETHLGEEEPFPDMSFLSEQPK